MVTPNSKYLLWFKEIEKTLLTFYQLFEDLCSKCAVYTINNVKNSSRKNRDLWCCCMIDNQVHDNWEILNNVQSKFDNNWYDRIKNNSIDLGRNRMPGNGPCPALGFNGCLLAKYRPITCTTQLCGKMLTMLYRLDIIGKFKSVPLQIEDIVFLPNILPILYGYKKGKKVELKKKQEYVRTIKELTAKFKSIDHNIRKKMVIEVMK